MTLTRSSLKSKKALQFGVETYNIRTLLLDYVRTGAFLHSLYFYQFLLESDITWGQLVKCPVLFKNVIQLGIALEELNNNENNSNALLFFIEERDDEYLKPVDAVFSVFACTDISSFVECFTFINILLEHLFNENNEKLYQFLLAEKERINNVRKETEAKTNENDVYDS